MLWLSQWSRGREAARPCECCSKVRLGRWASGERAQLLLWWIPDRLGRSADQPLPSTFTCDIVPGGGVEEETEGKVEGLQRRH